MEKEVSEGDRNLKMKMYFSEGSSLKKHSTVNNLWKQFGFFGERANDLSLNKADLPRKYIVLYKSRYSIHS